MNRRKRSLIDAFNAAIQGILYTFKSERNMRVHYFCAAFILMTSLLFNFTKLEIAVLSITVMLVLICEMINTAIEKTIDLITKDYNQLAKVAKDVAAGAVLLSSMISIIVGYILFFDKLTVFSDYILNSIRASSLHITLICLIMVLILVVVIKSYTSKGTPLRGGLPSGHAALAWCIATCIIFINQEIVSSTLSCILALLVSQSRIEGRIHTFWEVLAGSFLGIIVAILVFKFSLI